MQIPWFAPVADDRYVAESAWERAVLDQCPFHPRGGCGVSRHGTYGRVHPEGVQVPRFYCPLKGATISLLPAFLASRLSATLDEVEAVIDTVERASSIAAAVDAARPASDDDAVTSTSAARWVRRRLRPMKAALLALVTLLPELSGCEAKLGVIRARLDVERALVRLREIAGAHLPALAPPLGFRTRESR